VLVWQARQRMAAALGQAQDEREAARSQRKLTRQAVDELYTEVADQLLNAPELKVKQRAFLEKALLWYDKLAQAPSAEAEEISEVAAACQRVGLILRRLGRSAEAEQAHGRAIALWENLVAEFPDEPRYRRDLGEACHNRAMTREDTGRISEAEQDYHRAIALQRQVAEVWPDDPKNLESQARHYYNLGRVRGYTGRPAEAVQDFARALALWRQAPWARPDSRTEREFLASCHVSLAHNLALTGRRHEAEQAYREALRPLQQLATDHPQEPIYRINLIQCLTSLRSLLGERAPPEQIEREYRKALELFQELAAQRPNDASKWWPALIYHNLGNLYRNTGRRAEAAAAYRHAIKLQEEAISQGPTVQPWSGTKLSNFHLSLGNLFLESEQIGDAEACFLQALRLQKELSKAHPAVPEFQQDLANTNCLLGRLYRETGRPAEAERAYREALGLQLRLAAEHSAMPVYGNDLAWLLATCPDVSLRNASQAVEFATKAVADAPQTGNFLNTLGVAHYRAGNWPAAIAALEKSMSLRAGGDAFDWFFLAMAYHRIGDPYRPVLYYVAAVRWMETHNPRDDELRRFRAEAAALLGVRDDKAEEGPPPPRKD
jgi:tetratricopeptide (TPR) repeat protein